MEGSVGIEEEAMRHAFVYAGVTLVCVAWAVSAEQDNSKKEPAKEAFKLSNEEKKLIELVNQERKINKLPELKVNELLCKVARAHSANMARQEKLLHVLDGKNPSQRLKEANYDYSYNGENIAYALNETLEKVLKQWMDSPLHKKNILDKEFSETGLGAAPAKDGTVYYTQMFGTPR
jgi:uncharacterized protein YkwD